MKKNYCFNLEEELKRHPLPEGKDLMLRFLMHCKYSGANVAQARATKYHIHRDHDEYVYILRGEHEFNVNGIRYNVKPGDLIIAPAGVPHSPTKLGPDYGALSIYAPDWDEDNPDRIFIEK
jgi:mannose-6-phosphate isomerase-like protein (cupin superfamily)